jgi:aspartate kinase
MRIIVQKFGGTSVKTAPQRERVAEWVKRAVDDGYRPVVVVSAMGRRGDPYATDTLLDLVPKTTPARELDLLAHCGEVIAAVVLTTVLERRGLRARALTGGQAGLVTDDSYGRAQIIEVNSEAVRALLADGVVPVVAGFQGRTPDGEVTTLGRGGSDTTAAALGAALRAEVVDIFTDVDGIKTADPRIVPGARTLATLDYEEVFHMANLGARVVHPRAVEIARQFQVPMRIRNTFSSSEGTLVVPSVGALDPWAHRDPDSAVNGVTYLDGIVQVECAAPPHAHPHWTLELFQRLAALGISVDLINVFPERVYFTVPSARAEATEAVLQDLALEARLHPDRAKVSIVGSAIHGLPGVMARVMAALARAGVPVLQSADSHSTISCLVPRADMERAVQALHEQFHLAGLDVDAPPAGEPDRVGSREGSE